MNIPITGIITICTEYFNLVVYQLLWDLETLTDFTNSADCYTSSFSTIRGPPIEKHCFNALSESVKVRVLANGRPSDLAKLCSIASVTEELKSLES